MIGTDTVHDFLLPINSTNTTVQVNPAAICFFSSWEVGNLICKLSVALTASSTDHTHLYTDEWHKVWLENFVQLVKSRCSPAVNWTILSKQVINGPVASFDVCHNWSVVANRVCLTKENFIKHQQCGDDWEDDSLVGGHHNVMNLERQHPRKCKLWGEFGRFPTVAHICQAHLLRLTRKELWHTKIRNSYFAIRVTESVMSRVDTSRIRNPNTYHISLYELRHTYFEIFVWTGSQWFWESCYWWRWNGVETSTKDACAQCAPTEPRSSCNLQHLKSCCVCLLRVVFVPWLAKYLLLCNFCVAKTVELWIVENNLCHMPKDKNQKSHATVRHKNTINDGMIRMALRSHALVVGSQWQFILHAGVVFITGLTAPWPVGPPLAQNLKYQFARPSVHVDIIVWE